MIHWLELPERPIHSHTHTHTPAKTYACLQTHTLGIHLFLSRVRQPVARTQRENTQTHTHTHVSKPDGNKPRQTQNKQRNHSAAPFTFIKIPTMHLHDEREARWQTEDQSLIDKAKESLPCDPDVNINTHRADESITVMMKTRISQCLPFIMSTKEDTLKNVWEPNNFGPHCLTPYGQETLGHFSNYLISCTGLEG